MHSEVLQTLDDLAGLAGEWNHLLSLSATDVPFLRHEYLATWWRTLGGGEWQHGDLFVVVTRHPDGSLAGIAPLFFGPNREGEPALLLLGSLEISDYLDFIARPTDLSAFVPSLTAFLDSPQAPPWRVLDLYNLPEESPTLPALKAAANDCGWAYQQNRLQPCPAIALPGDWEGYLAGIDKKQRHEIRRKMRRAADSPQGVRWCIVTDPANLDADIDIFFELMAADPEKAAFLTPAMQAQMRASTWAAFHNGWLQLAFLEIAGQKVAAYLNFDYGNRIWVYNSGLGSDFRELSPGWVLLGHLLQWANEHGRTAFDFMRGDEDYKYRFGGQNRFITRVTLRR